MRAPWIAVLCLAGCPSPTPTPPAPPQPGSGGGGSGSDGGGSNGSGQTPSSIPPALAVPAGNQLVLAASAKGVQIYECAPDPSSTTGALAWKLHAPRATLFDAAGNQVAVHFGGVDKGLPAGPYWQASDGSRVHGANPVSVPNPGSIPLLRLDAADTSGNGVFTKVTFIQRLETTGGVAPAGACTSGTTEVAYTAKYNFYAKP